MVKILPSGGYSVLSVKVPDNQNLYTAMPRTCVEDLVSNLCLIRGNCKAAASYMLAGSIPVQVVNRLSEV